MVCIDCHRMSFDPRPPQRVPEYTTWLTLLPTVGAHSTLSVVTSVKVTLGPACLTHGAEGSGGPRANIGLASMANSRMDVLTKWRCRPRRGARGNGIWRISGASEIPLGGSVCWQCRILVTPVHRPPHDVARVGCPAVKREVLKQTHVSWLGLDWHGLAIRGSCVDNVWPNARRVPLFTMVCERFTGQ